MNRQHYAIGRNKPIRCIVLHATAGTYPGDLDWLKNGGSTAYPVSCHYYIDKAGTVSQLVRDEDTAWHAGQSSWLIDGVRVNNLNGCSLGIELSNSNSGKEPYPAEQVHAAVDLVKLLVAKYTIPRSQVVRHLDIAPGRKTDPVGFNWAGFVAQVFDLPLTRVIGARPSISLTRFINLLETREAPFGANLITIGTRIYSMCDWLDIDPAFWLAVWSHEQGVPLGSSEIGQQTRNPLNIKAYGRWPATSGFNVYESWQTGCMASVLHLKEFYGAKGMLDVESIIPVFAPANDGNKPDAYIAAVLRDMKAIRGA